MRAHREPRLHAAPHRRLGAARARARRGAPGAAARGAPFDLVEDLAIPLPVTLIAEMLGVEPARQRDFKRWSDHVIDAIDRARAAADPFPPRIVDTILELLSYLRRDRRGSGAARPADDLISLIVARAGRRDGALDREVVQFVMLLLVAGNETTTNLIGNAVDALLDHPDELARVAARPGAGPRRRRGGAALRLADPGGLPHRDAGRRARGRAHPEGRLRGAAARLGQPRRAPLPGARPLRRRRATRRATSASASASTSASARRSRGSRRASRSRRSCRSCVRLEREAARREVVDSFLVRGPRRLELVPAAAP